MSKKKLSEEQEQYRKNLRELQQSIKSKVTDDQLMKNEPNFRERWWEDEPGKGR